MSLLRSELVEAILADRDDLTGDRLRSRMIVEDERRVTDVDRFAPADSGHFPAIDDRVVVLSMEVDNMASFVSHRTSLPQNRPSTDRPSDSAPDESYCGGGGGNTSVKAQSTMTVEMISMPIAPTIISPGDWVWGPIRRP